MHFHANHAVALAGLAATALDVERVAAGAVAARLGLGQGREEIANVGENAGEGRRVGSRCAADGRLVDIDDFVQVLQAIDTVEFRAGCPRPVQTVFERGQKRVDDQARLARAGHAGHAGERPQRKADREVAQVVRARPAQHQSALVGAAPALGRLNGLFTRQIRAGQRLRIRLDLLGRAHGHHAAAQLARAWAHVDDVVGGADGLGVVLNHQHGVAQIAKLDQGLKQAAVVSLVQADAGLVEDIQHALQTAADLRGQANALGLAARKRGGRPVERQVVDAHADEEAQTAGHLADDTQAHLPVAFGQSQALDEVVRVPDGQRRHLGDGLAAHADVTRLLAQARAAALAARRLRHVAMELVVDGLEILVGGAALLAPPALILVVAPLQVGQHAFEVLLEGVLLAVLLEGQVQLFALGSFEDQLAHLGRQLVPGLVQIDAVVGGQRVEQLLEEGAVAAFPGLDGAFPQRQVGIADHEVGVEVHLSPDAVAGRASAGRAIERKQAGTDLGKSDAAVGAGERLGKEQIVAFQGRDLDQAA